jgi:hypothetical protein
MRFVASLLCLCATLSVAPFAQAGPYGEPVGRDAQAQRNEARKHATAGFKALRAGRYRDAIAQFERAEALVHAPTHRLYMAQAHRALGELLRARGLYRDISTERPGADDPEPFRKARRDAVAELAALQPFIPVLELRTRGATVTSVTVDGEALANIGRDASMALDPGRHEVVVVVDGKTERRTFTVIEGQTYSLELLLQERAPTAQGASGGVDARLVLGIAAGGLGLAAVVVGTATGVASLGKVDELDRACPDRSCTAAERPIADDARFLGDLSTVSFVVAGVALATAVPFLVWSLTGGDDPEVASTRLSVGPTGAELEVAF